MSAGDQRQDDQRRHRHAHDERTPATRSYRQHTLFPPDEKEKTKRQDENSEPCDRSRFQEKDTIDRKITMGTVQNSRSAFVSRNELTEVGSTSVFLQAGFLQAVFMRFPRLTIPNTISLACTWRANGPTEIGRPRFARKTCRNRLVWGRATFLFQADWSESLQGQVVRFAPSAGRLRPVQG